MKRRSWSAGLFLLVLLPTFWFVGHAVWLTLVKRYSIDELTYSHGAWLVSKGIIPCRDFFETKFFLHYLFLCVPFLVAGGDPTAIFYLRVVMLPFLGFSLWAIFLLNSRWHWATGFIGVVLAASHWMFTVSATEIRPDAIALSFLLLSLAVFFCDRINVRSRGFIAGLLFTLCVCTTAKTFVFGIPICVAWLMDVTYHQRRKCGFLLGNPWAFLAGSSVILVMVTTYLISTDSWSSVYALTIDRNRQFLTGEIIRSWKLDILDFRYEVWWLYPFSLLGILVTIISVRKSKLSTADPEILLLAFIPSTLASFTVQAYPFRYSLLPFLGMWSIFTARGIGILFWFLWNWCRESISMNWNWRKDNVPLRWLLLPIAVFAFGCYLDRANIRCQRMLEKTNEFQHQVLTKIATLTSPDDFAYDNSGSYVARPHAYSPHHTDSVMRKVMVKELARDVPLAVLRSECVLCFRDTRFAALPKKLISFLESNFQQYSDDIMLWGHRYLPSDEKLQEKFQAITTGKYFVEPESALQEGTLRLDGKQVDDAIFELKKGDYSVQYEGAAKEFFILWLPRDGKTYSPKRNGYPSFSVVLVTP